MKKVYIFFVINCSLYIIHEKIRETFIKIQYKYKFSKFTYKKSLILTFY